MAVIRRFGPILGEGVVVEERAGEPRIQAGLFGVNAWSGIIEKGPTDELIEIVSKKMLTRQTGGIITGTDVPDCGEDFWDLSRGAGRLYLARITDGTGRKASIVLKSRETSGEGLGVWRDTLQFDGKSVGRWAGAYNRRIEDFPTDAATDLTETTLNTGLTLLEDEFAGGTLTLAEVTTKSYEIVSNTTAGVVTVRSDQTMSTDYGAGSDPEFMLFKSNVDSAGITKNLAVLIKDGARDPATEFGVELYQNGVKTGNYNDASMDPNSDVYVRPQINDDAGNYETTVTDLFTLTGGTVTADVRPANQFGTIPTGGLAATVLTIEPVQARIPVGNTGDGGIGTFTIGANVQVDLLTLTVTDDTTPGSEVWSVVSSEQDKDFSDATTAVVYPAENAWTVGFTITAGTADWANGDQIFVIVEPLIVDEAIGGKLYYDYGVDPTASLEIVDNDRTTVTVRPQNDLTALSAEGKLYRLQYRKGLSKGYDGHAGVAVSDHRAAWDPTTSLFNRLRGRNLGLVKFASPGETDTTLQQDIKDYADQYGGQNRYELPTSSVTNEIQAANYVQNTLGRADLAAVTFPSFYNKQKQDALGTKEVSATGMIAGLEARKAVQAQGYHEQAVGESAVLTKVVSLPTGEAELDREILAPAGIQSIKKVGANFVHWGNTVPNLNAGSSSKKNKREQLTHYINVLRESFGFIVFEINDPETRDDALTALRSFFIPEWRPKRALRGDRFEDAAEITIDDSNNTAATEAAGDLNAEITLRIVDLIDRFKISIGEAGIFETMVA
jgi:hypothetical protein